MTGRTSAKTRKRRKRGDKSAAANVATPERTYNEAVDRQDIVRDGFTLDFISGTREVKETLRELVRQRIARALFHEYGISVEDMAADFPVLVGAGAGAWTSRSSPQARLMSPSTSSAWWSAALSRSRTSAAR